ncbi:MAG: AAA family ATPase, partial [Muribaculaceae bacterium]|nr:AAA family ATPase [Muribaculaceae bacterium]
MKSVEISNFKNFRYLKVDNLKRLNLIIGKNNTGKSTLLEALSIIASAADTEWIKRLITQRGLVYVLV